MSTTNHGEYYIPEPSKWPIVGTIALTTTVIGAVNTIHAGGEINLLLPVGLLLIAYLLFGWFGAVVDESMAGKYNEQVDRSFRIGMLWFIFSEVMFFAAFFGVLFYVRVFIMDWLAGGSNNAMTHELLWPGFEAVWPLLTNPDNAAVAGPDKAMGPTGLPAINTAILLLSSVTVTIAHHALRQDHRKPLIIWLAATVALGMIFLFFQVEEYVYAYRELGLTLDSGIYGSTFFMLTGFHGMHVTIGTTMLLVMLVRAIKGHFTSDNHFAFEAVAWYWHFVDVVWLGLFIFVYWL
ncbi:MAG: cytochrome c oxidase subunit 3 [Gammaproteobacteria bacterium]|nr:cytochrome c oxidase subunit 3 [Gammaproteobacteria bacterium]NNJ98561.1 cytochrome c oxidase subunit 3 [Gammaproteobacteria bacterium]